VVALPQPPSRLGGVCGQRAALSEGRAGRWPASVVPAVTRR